jgi:hypothetical protein
MTGLLILAIIVALVAVVGVLAQEFGVDSRPSDLDTRLATRDMSI